MHVLGLERDPCATASVAVAVRQALTGLAEQAAGAIVVGMSTVTEIEAAIEKLSLQEQGEIAGWLNSRLIAETPAMLAALDEGIRSLEEKGAREVTREQLEQRVRQWAGA